MPPLGLLLGGVDFENLFVNLGPADYATLAEAKAAGAPALAYGNFLQTVVDFLIIAWAIFLMVKMINRMRRKQEAALPAPPAPAEEIVLLREIRDTLRK
jgi:large conductance mechanosensitive channel